MFHVEKMEPQDFPFAIELTDTMNWNMTNEDFEFNMRLEPSGCFTLFDHQERVGLATCISYRNLGWFGNLIVKASCRNKGAGTFLVNHAVNYLRSLGVTRVGLYANLNVVDFYEAMGFRRDEDFVFLTATPVSFTDRTQNNLKILEKQQIPEIVDFDRRCFGGYRKKLLEQILQTHENLGFVAKDNTKLVGYVAAKVYGDVAEIGPLVCLQKKPKTALKLLSEVLSKLHGSRAYMSLPVAETGLLDLASKAGFQEKFRVARMFLGSAAAQDWVYIAESLERG
jgi:ribosomal protein S18 acetylase RimI-like enzyme